MLRFSMKKLISNWCDLTFNTLENVLKYLFTLIFKTFFIWPYMLSFFNPQIQQESWKKNHCIKKQDLFEILFG